MSMKISRAHLSEFGEAMCIALKRLTDSQGLKIYVPVNYELVEKTALAALSINAPYAVTVSDVNFENWTPKPVERGITIAEVLGLTEKGNNSYD